MAVFLVTLPLRLNLYVCVIVFKTLLQYYLALSNIFLLIVCHQKSNFGCETDSSRTFHDAAAKIQSSQIWSAIIKERPLYYYNHYNAVIKNKYSETHEAGNYPTFYVQNKLPCPIRNGASIVSTNIWTYRLWHIL